MTDQGHDGDHSPQSPSLTCLVVGCSRPVPGQTSQEAFDRIMGALRSAAGGQQVLHLQGQQGEWLHKCFIATQLDVGKRTWRAFKKKYQEDIELDTQQQWVRLRARDLS